MGDIIIRYTCAFGRAGERKKPGKDLTVKEAKKLMRAGYAVPASGKAPVIAVKAKDGEDQNRILKPEKKAVKPSSGKKGNK